MILDDALSWLEQSQIESKLKNAIEKRLSLHEELLAALEGDTAWSRDRRATGFRSCLSFLKAIRATTALGQRVPDAFSSKIQRRLASSVPPRPVVSLDIDEALANFERFCLDVADVEQVFAAETNGSLLTAITTFMSRRPQPSVYVRAVLQSRVYRDEIGFRDQSMTDLVFSDLDALVLPNSPLLQGHYDGTVQQNGYSGPTQPAKLLIEFVERAGLTYINMFRTLCLNRSRMRRTLCHSVIELDSIQAEAEDIDTLLREAMQEEAVVYTSSPDPTYAYPLSSWLYHYKLCQLEQIIQLGFELTIYAIDEIPKMYWYLSHICTTHLSHLDRISFFVEHEGRSRSNFPVPVGHEPSNPVVEHEAKVHEATQNLDRQFVLVRATDSLARALHLLYTVLDRRSALQKPSRPYSSDRLRYELRIRPFLSLSIPEPVSYEDFERESSLVHVSDSELLDSASRAVISARKWWEEVLATKWLDDSIQAAAPPKDSGTPLQAQWVSGIKNTIRACIGTSIAIATLKKKVDESPSDNLKEKQGTANKAAAAIDVKVEIPMPGEKGCWHDWWIVPKIL